jgi:hypothetical protein
MRAPALLKAARSVEGNVSHPMEPSKRGFGSTVLCSVVERSFDAKAELDFAVTGLTWR